MTDTHSPTIQTPRELSRKYRFISLLGEGANGKTWLALNINEGIKVAVKELKFSQNDDFKSLELFKREAATLSSIKMEGVPRFYESIFPKDVNDTCYIIQEYVQFPSLQTILDNLGRLTEKETLETIERVSLILFGLQTIYTPPIIHRDIKPSNILCEKKPDGKVDVYLIDFGAVANPQRRSGGSTVAGTFGYMAPEQLLGDVCIQSDYYSLGATAFQMITGVPPWKLSSDMFKVDFESALKEYAPEASVAFKSLLETLLAPEIEKRPINGRQLVDFVHSVQNGKPVSVQTKAEMAERTGKKSFLERIYDKIMPSGINMHVDTWMKTNGTIWSARVVVSVTNQTLNAYEYTFEINDQTYVGIQSIDGPPASVFPQKCTVLFDPMNPRNNILTEVPSGFDKPSKNIDKLKSIKY